MSETTIVRTPNMIAAEINGIKEQTRKVMLVNALEIGRRLVEAKTIIDHGQWGNWLKSTVDYSQSTATNLMRLFTEYGADQLSIFGDNTKSQAFEKLTYTQAVSLLGIPEEQREQFVEDNNVEQMSSRELQKLIKEKQKAEEAQKAAEQQAEEAQKQAAEAEERKKVLEQKAKENNATVKQLKQQLKAAQQAGDMSQVEQLESNLKGAQEALSESEKRIKDLEEQLENKSKAEIVERVPESVEKELEELRSQVAKSQNNIAAIKFAQRFEQLAGDLQQLLGELVAVKESDSALHEKYAGAVRKLFGNVEQQL